MKMKLSEGVRPLEARYLDATANLVAEAMEVDSAYRYLFPERDKRGPGLRDLFVRNLRLHMGHRCTYVALDERGEVTGTATLRPPGGIDMSALTMLRRGLLPFAMRHGRGAVQRLLWLKRTYDALEAEIAGHKPHWYLHMMAVQPERQGRGVGGALLNRVLDLNRDRQGGPPIVLTTHLSRNLKFYQRAHFELRWERAVTPPHGSPYPVWAMAYG